MGVSQKGARKWLEGEAYPTLDKQLELAKLARVSFQWLMTGEGPHPHEGLTPNQRSMVQLMEAMTEEQQDELIKRAEEKERQNREVIGELSRKLMGGQTTVTNRHANFRNALEQSSNHQNGFWPVK